MLLFFFVCIAYFILITRNFYEVSSAILEGIFPYNAPGSSQIVFSKYSLQWAAIIAFLVLKQFLFRKELDFMLKLMGYSIYCIAAYAVFILLNLIRHIAEGNIHLR
jgi:sodium-coupled neutral amino acid transporter 9